jgi:tRNA (cytidine/uridine-2'-O-)-methyltransferase
VTGLARRLQIVLVEPRIPQNVGAVARLAAATQSPLHIVRPIPFVLNDASLRRAGMDYLEIAAIHVHAGWPAFCAATPGTRRWFLTSRGRLSIYTVDFEPGDCLVFGSEEAGLPEWLGPEMEGRDVVIPMPEPRARCLNLATSVAIATYAGLHRLGAVG